MKTRYVVIVQPRDPHGEGQTPPLIVGVYVDLMAARRFASRVNARTDHLFDNETEGDRREWNYTPPGRAYVTVLSGKTIRDAVDHAMGGS